ncbi:two-component regulator propeller domain-containing protein [Niastella sp. OAS944]|uniref:hybrid sensor histidine kinase/response regulator transcription factor n=1 Tax=Niastella sp. OAS944 TaxID=2664089 RepID=UPI0035C863EA|nr:ligand-binding sensor domain-containing protein/signal transduction histidine kinase/AraC-like DNA-binding protein [Chitinophagaceae bacterium OAS944]
MFSVLLFCAWLCTGVNGLAQGRRFTHLSVEDGLSQSSVISIVQDSAGFMWFGTRNCLNRYNTRSFQVYRNIPGDTNSISSNDYVFALLRDRRNRLWVGTQRGLNLYLPQKDAFERMLADSTRPGSISQIYINCIYEDRSGRIWVGTNNGLNLLTGENPGRFQNFFPGVGMNEIHAICEDKQGALWVGTAGGLVCMNYKNGKANYTYFTHQPNVAGSLSCNNVSSIVECRGELWVGTECGGLNLLDRNTNNFQHFTHSNHTPGSISSDIIRKMIVDESQNLWIATIDGLNYFETANRAFTVYRNDPEDAGSLSNNSIRDLYIDKYGSLWVGTVFGGVNVTHAIATPFTIYKTSRLVNSISSNVVSAITADEKQNLWIGTEAEGLNYFDCQRNTFIHYKNDPADPRSLSRNFIKAIYKDKQNVMWIGTYDGGLNRFNPATKTFTHYRHNADDSTSLSGDNIICMGEDSRGRFWVGAYGKGLNLFNRETGRSENFTTHPASRFRISSNWVRLVYEDRHKNLWVGTAHGLNVLPPGEQRFTWFYKQPGNKDSLNSDYINCMLEDSKGRIWIGTYDGGLSLYHPNTQSFSTYTMQNGLPGNNVRGILEDEQGYLWLSTENGLCRFNGNKGQVLNYNIFDGLPGNEFNYNSYYRDANGQFFFGGFTGMVSFYPQQMRVNESIPPVVFTGLKLFNKPVGIRDESGLLQSAMSYTRRIDFAAAQNIFTIEFAALNYIKSGKNRYAYKLDGFEKDWNIVDNPAATYTNLPSGRYTFLVRASNNDGVWNNEPARLEIVVHPPLWKTWWAYLIYFIVAVLLLYITIRFFRRQARLERDLYYEHQQKMQQEELHQQKIDFFTNISHEIRTPLTLIVGPVENLLANTPVDSTVNRQLALVKKNADRLIRLVSELLDFRKAESGNMQLSVSEGNIVAFTRTIFLSFRDLANSRSITYMFMPLVNVIEIADNITCWFDPVQLEKVLFNLLSNAFKFTSEGGDITVVVREDNEKELLIAISNSGPVVPKEQQEKLFNRFYQMGNTPKGLGTGIGLALSKSIIEAHGGRIEIESASVNDDDQNGTTCFTIYLPLGKAHFTKEQLTGATGIRNAMVEKQTAPGIEVAITPMVEEENATTTAKPSLLLVEDNDDIRQMIRNALSAQYDITEASNGASGWQTVTELIPDLVISDVMMEGEDDGFTLCDRIKTDERTNHIPVILLTARAAPSSQITGLQTGADAYITKPFFIQVLELQVRNLLSLRNINREKFTRQITLQPPAQLAFATEPPEAPTAETLFLQKLVAMVEENMEDPEFGVPVLLKKAGMSQTVLYRKLKALTDMSIADFIKSVRLKKAAELLRQPGNDISIAEVAYRVGFSDRKYFSKEFRKQFGQSPTEFINKGDEHLDNEG